MNLAAWAERNGVSRVGSQDIQVALGAQCRELVVADSAEVDDSLVRDMTEVLTCMCARWYGKRAAANRAKRALGGCGV